MNNELLNKLNIPTNSNGYIDLLNVDPLEIMKKYDKETIDLESKLQELINNRKSDRKKLFGELIDNLIWYTERNIERLSKRNSKYKVYYIERYNNKLNELVLIRKKLLRIDSTTQQEYDKSIDDILQIS